MYTLENVDVSRKQAFAPNTSCGNSTVVVNKARNNGEDYQNWSYWSFQIIYSKHLHINLNLTLTV